MVNGRTKGHDAERDIARMLNAIVDEVLEAKARPRGPADKPLVQRNQNQSAVGGDDLVGTFEFSIEVKRCETLELKKWWQQATKSAAAQGKVPVLMYKQNRKDWRIRMPGGIGHPSTISHPMAEWLKVGQLEVGMDDFLALWRKVCIARL